MKIRQMENRLRLYMIQPLTMIRFNQIKKQLKSSTTQSLMMIRLSRIKKILMSYLTGMTVMRLAMIKTFYLSMSVLAQLPMMPLARDLLLAGQKVLVH